MVNLSPEVVSDLKKHIASQPPTPQPGQPVTAGALALPPVVGGTSGVINPSANRGLSAKDNMEIAKAFIKTAFSR